MTNALGAYASTNVGPNSSDEELYAGMGYGTPHHAYMLGQQAFGASFDQLGRPVLIPVMPSAASREAYINLYRRAQTDPVLNYGLDMGTVAPVGIAQWPVSLARQGTNGLWDQQNGQGAALVINGNTNALAHEHLHRNMGAMMADPDTFNAMAAARRPQDINHLAGYLSGPTLPHYLRTRREHEMIGAAIHEPDSNAPPPNDQATVERYRLLQGVAQSRINAMRNPMGPR